MIAGGAAGIVAIARELGADDRVVAVVQYLRVLVITLGMPLVAGSVFPNGDGDASVDGLFYVTQTSAPVDLVVTAASVAGGLLLARLVPISAGPLLFPLLVAVAIAVSGVAGPVAVPAWLQDAGFALIGLQVGLRFTRASLRAVLGLLPLALGVILALIVACAACGVVLAQATGQSQLDGYLATTPGGLYAVLAVAVGTGSDVTFVFTLQVARLLVILACAPLLARWLRRRDDGTGGPIPAEGFGGA